MKEELEIAKKIITEEVENEGFKIIKILLFGSRARGNYTDESDWDFLVVLDSDISFSKLKKLVGKIQLRFARLNLPNDLILKGLNQFNRSKEVVGNISYYADKEGIVI